MYAFLGKTNVEAFDVAITTTISIWDRMDSGLFHSGSTYSYVGLNLVCGVLNYLICVSTMAGESMVITHVYRSYSILFVYFHT